LASFDLIASMPLCNCYILSQKLVIRVQLQLTVELALIQLQPTVQLALIQHLQGHTPPLFYKVHTRGMIEAGHHTILPAKSFKRIQRVR
jgi:hypothetical protein